MSAAEMPYLLPEWAHLPALRNRIKTGARWCGTGLSVVWPHWRMALLAMLAITATYMVMSIHSQISQALRWDEKFSRFLADAKNECISQSVGAGLIAGAAMFGVRGAYVAAMALFSLACVWHQRIIRSENRAVVLLRRVAGAVWPFTWRLLWYATTWFVIALAFATAFEADQALAGEWRFKKFWEELGKDAACTLLLVKICCILVTVVYVCIHVRQWSATHGDAIKRRCWRFVECGRI